MSDEIAEFLRRAAQRRAEQMQQQAEQQRRAAQQQYQPPQPPPRPAPLAPRPVVVEAEIVEDDEEPVPLRPALSRVSQHVSQHLDTSNFAQRAEHLGDVTEQADERMESHLRQAFDHRLGSMGAATESITADVTPAPDDLMRGRVAATHPLMGMLRNPQSVRNAIILAELLQRPEQNW